eukprot:767556-Hanusia_phi.AAC.8
MCLAGAVISSERFGPGSVTPGRSTGSDPGRRVGRGLSSTTESTPTPTQNGSDAHKEMPG